MRTAILRIVEREEGIALLTVLLLLLIVSALCAALAVSGQTEMLIARNHQSAAQAHAAAEAGLSHAVDVTVANLLQWTANGFASQSAAMTGLLLGPDTLANEATPGHATNADNGSLEALGIPRPPARLLMGGLAGVEYEARLMDDDDPARAAVMPANPAAAPMLENNQLFLDTNTRIAIQVIGYAWDGANVRLEALITPLTLPAIVTNGNLTISGNMNLGGGQGSVHSNGNLSLSGNPTISQNATGSGTYTASGSPSVGGTSGGGAPNITIPAIHAIDHRSKADFVLASTGRVTTLAGTVLCDASANNSNCEGGYGWKFDGANGWKIDSNSAVNGTFYVEGDARISGNPGSPGNELVITIIAEGSIEISGNPDLRPDSPELLFVTDGDLKIAGALGVPIAVEGLMLVHEQVMISGNPSLAGQLLVENAATVSTLVDQNTISGNATFAYNGIAGVTGFTVSGWRELR